MLSNWPTGATSKRDTAAMNYAGTQKFKHVKHHHTIITSVWQASVTVNHAVCQQLKLNDLETPDDLLSEAIK